MAGVGLIGASVAFALPHFMPDSQSRTATPSAVVTSTKTAYSTPTVASKMPSIVAPTPVSSTTSYTTPAPAPRQKTDPPYSVTGSATIMTTAGGKACSQIGSTTASGNYPSARCSAWQQAAGLRSGAMKTKGPFTVACQANLGMANPVFVSSQSNTWWLWAMSDDGTWDWFPETLISEGNSNSPVDGVALCVT